MHEASLRAVTSRALPGMERIGAWWKVLLGITEEERGRISIEGFKCQG